MQKLIEFLAKAWAPIGALICIGLGIFVCWSVYQVEGGSKRGARGGLLLIAIGIALLAKWALSSENKDYNF